MTTTTDWYSKVFTDEEIETAKTEGKTKQALLAKKYGAYNNLVHETGYRWIGDLGEITFQEMMLTKYDRTDGIDIVRHTSLENIDDRDFTLSQKTANLEIDVKTTLCTSMPRPDYLVNLNATQYQKMLRPDNPINTLVFSRFIEPQKRAIVFGWIFKREFVKTAKFFKKGDRSGQIIINTDVYCIEIGNLMPFKKANS